MSFKVKRLLVSLRLKLKMELIELFMKIKWWNLKVAEDKNQNFLKLKL